MEEEIDLKQVLQTMWAKKIAIIIIVAISMVVGAIYSKKMVQPEYKAKTSLVLVKNDQQAENSITQTDITLNQKLVATYSQLVKSNKVIREVIKNTGTTIKENALRKAITVEAVKSTQLIEITVVSKEAEEAALLTNEIATVFIKQVKEIYHMENINVVDTAKVPEEPYNINIIKDVLIFAIIGIVISMNYVVVANLFDSTIKNKEIVEQKLGINVLSCIPKNMVDKQQKNSELITHELPKAPISETFRTLRTNLQFMRGNKKFQTILVTSSIPGEGKSWVSANMAVAFAQEGKKVIIVDADMRKGRMATIFKIDKKPGLSNYLSGIEESEFISNYIRPTNIENLSILPAGDVPPNPSELLVTQSTEQLIEELKNLYDIVIFDGTPCLLVTDATILARKVDATLLISAFKKTKIKDLEEVKKRIENVGGNVIGMVLNKIPIASKKYQSSYYYGNKEKT